jgi:hypothetical protein
MWRRHDQAQESRLMIWHHFNQIRDVYLHEAAHEQLVAVSTIRGKAYEESREFQQLLEDI